LTAEGEDLLDQVTGTLPGGQHFFEMALHPTAMWDIVQGQFTITQNRSQNIISRFTNLSSMTRLDLGCWVHEKAQPSTPRAEP
jgi:hypothetical protein